MVLDRRRLDLIKNKVNYLFSQIFIDEFSCCIQSVNIFDIDHHYQYHHDNNRSDLFVEKQTHIINSCDPHGGQEMMQDVTDR